MKHYLLIVTWMIRLLLIHIAWKFYLLRLVNKSIFLLHLTVAALNRNNLMIPKISTSPTGLAPANQQVPYYLRKKSTRKLPVDLDRFAKSLQKREERSISSTSPNVRQSRRKSADSIASLARTSSGIGFDESMNSHQLLEFDHFSFLSVYFSWTKWSSQSKYKYIAQSCWCPTKCWKRIGIECSTRIPELDKNT